MQTRRRTGPGVLSVEPGVAHPWLGIASLTLGVGLAVNSLLGPLIAEAIEYPLSGSALDQTMGLEAACIIRGASM